MRDISPFCLSPLYFLVFLLYNKDMEGLTKIVVASGNAHKIAEIADILQGIEVLSMRDAGYDVDIEENGSSFAENALIKAKAVAEALGVPALADDSGLCVDALGDAPGIYSARFSGGDDADNRALLLKKLQDADDRRARFECAVCLYQPGGQTIFGHGATYGRITKEERGERGFGYDSLFLSDDLKKTFAEATEDEKNAVSHRFRALQDLRSKL